VIAGYAGLPRGARRVGRALRVLPSKSKVPWHRVVNAEGRIALARGSAGEKRQRRLLISEDVTFQHNRIDLKRFGWRHTLDELLWGPEGE
jgi:methylated-DNA-protein-cysteine methyltransferase-like protein